MCIYLYIFVSKSNSKLSVLFFILLSYSAIANNEAARPTAKFSIDNSISNNVLYLPISDNEIKSIKIVDSCEELIDLSIVDDARIKPIHIVSKDYKLAYDGCTKVRKGLYLCLKKMLTYLPSNVGIAIEEGWRPLSMQKKYFDTTFLRQYKKFKDPQVAYSETCKYVSPFIDNIPTHCTGAAVDMTLFIIQDDNTVKLLDLGDFNAVSNTNDSHQTFSLNVTDE